MKESRVEFIQLVVSDDTHPLEVEGGSPGPKGGGRGQEEIQSLHHRVMSR